MQSTPKLIALNLPSIAALLDGRACFAVGTEYKLVLCFMMNGLVERMEKSAV